MSKQIAQGRSQHNDQMEDGGGFAVAFREWARVKSVEERVVPIESGVPRSRPTTHGVIVPGRGGEKAEDGVMWNEDEAGVDLRVPQKVLTPSRDSSFTSIASIPCTEDDEVRPATDSADIHTPLEQAGRSPSLLSAHSSIEGSVLESPWSPASTVRSTLPIDTEEESPETHVAMTVDGIRGLRIESPSDFASGSGMPSPSSGGFGDIHVTRPVDKELSFLGWSKEWGSKDAARVMPKTIAMEHANGRSVSLGNTANFVRDDDVPHTTPMPSSSLDSTYAVVHLDKSPAEPFEDSCLKARMSSSDQDTPSPVDERVSTNPDVLPSCHHAIAHAIADTPTNLSNLPSLRDATSDIDDENYGMERIEDISDAEECGPSPRRTTLAKIEPCDSVTAPLRDADPAVSMSAEPGMILPCAPSDEEKVLYHRTGRFVMITFGFLALSSIVVGMWMFTMASSFFYWLCAPTVLVLLYFICHYFLVSLWGKDFDPDEHAEVVKKATEQKYLPTIDVFLPVCNEPLAVLANTWKNIAAMDYPRASVYVLDDGANDDVRHLAKEHGFQYILRTNRPEMKKAGNLRYAFARTSGDLVVIFDADFCPRTDFLRETVPYLTNPSVGLLQTPQFFRRRDEQTWIEQGAGVTLEFFYRMVQTNRDHFHAAVCSGSCGVYRRAAIEPLGGVVAIEHSEDMYTGYKMTELGYQIKYLPLCLAMGVCPDEPDSYFMQQYRWCMGTVTLVFEMDFWTANTSRIHKMCFVSGMLYYVATALFIFLGPMPILLLIWIKADEVMWYHSGFTVPSIIFSCIVVPWWSKAKFGMASYRVQVLQSYAHLFAIKDYFMGSVAAWVPSGGGASRESSKVYNSSVWCLVVWNTVSTVLIVGGSIWKMVEHPWYNFVPCIILVLCSFCLSMSTLVY